MERRKLIEMTCKMCGNTFLSTTQTAKYCPGCRLERNRQISREAKRRKTNEARTTCARCGKPFDKPSKTKLYCDACKIIVNRERNRENSRKKWSEKSIRKCTCCGDEYETPKASTSRLCPACRKLTEEERREVKSLHKHRIRLDDEALAAKEAGLSYGYYKAWQAGRIVIARC